MSLPRFTRSRLLRWSGIVAGVVVAVYALTSFLIAFGFSLPARATPTLTPGDYGASFDDVTLPSGIDNVELSGWYLPGGGNITVIVMPGGRSSRGEDLALCVDLVAAGYNVLSLDRRGCGLSNVPSLGGRGHIERDFQGAVAWVRQRSGDSEQVFLLGSSIGAMAAFVYADGDPAAGLQGIIADSAFATRRAIAERVLNQALPLTGVFAPGALFFGERFFGLPNIDSIDIVGDISVPILFIEGDCDKQIPVTETRALYQASANPADGIMIVPGAAHSAGYRAEPAAYLDRVSAFIAANVTPGS